MRTSNKDDDDKQGGLLIPGYHYISPSNSADRIPSPERAAFYRAFGWGMEWISGGWMKSLWTKGLETQTTLISPVRLRSSGIDRCPARRSVKINTSQEPGSSVMENSTSLPFDWGS
ncbi:hypothetical protein ACO22_04638 [Paracoccidioides brasiliensis]|uniref:Uncharacterized protein n=1 Tax=Paracoccidioides brasiliensis TaxID=121759 RepID=A0A1D2JCK7_PARBR|nr:hypothetical protein ACO22_04638 [Paracoccidioides brasiliensis]